MRVRRFQLADAEAISRLNQRLRSFGVTDVVYPEGAEQHRKGTIRERLLVAEDGEEIRGGVWLREQLFRIHRQDVVCGWLKYPVAESLIDPRFSGIPASLLMQCLREQPRLLGLGMGGHDTPVARMVRALRWPGTTVPMMVKVVRPARCLRELAPFRRSAARRFGSSALAMSGLPWAALRIWDIVSTIRRAPRDYQAEPCERLGPWADDLWLRYRDDYEFIASRDADTVESVLPDTPDIHRLRITRKGETIGWVYAVRHDFGVGAPDRNFGRLRVGLIADCLARPSDAPAVVALALDLLRDLGVDIVFSQQLHASWHQALRDLGFLNAPSNFAFYTAPRAVQPAIAWDQFHINRGDMDGPMWYLGR